MTAPNSEVLYYAQLLCDTLKKNYEDYSIRNFERDTNSEYVQQCLNKIKEGTYDFGYEYLIEEAKKYLKIVMKAHSSGSVHAFVDKNTGDVYKAASWKSPAKGIRFNLLDDTSRQECYSRADWAGSYLYVR